MFHVLTDIVFLCVNVHIAITLMRVGKIQLYKVQVDPTSEFFYHVSSLNVVRWEKFILADTWHESRENSVTFMSTELKMISVCISSSIFGLEVTVVRSSELFRNHVRTRSHTSANRTFVATLLTGVQASVSAPPAFVVSTGMSHTHWVCECVGIGQSVVLWPLQFCTTFPLAVNEQFEEISSPVTATVYA